MYNSSYSNLISLVLGNTMLATFYAMITVLAWGIWLAPSQNISFKNQQVKTFYVGLANLALTTLVFLFQGTRDLTWDVFWLPFTGGLVWAVSGFMAFTATDRLGMARAYGLWAPINVVVSIFWGIVIFDEFISMKPLTYLLLVISLAIIITGILLIIFAKGSGSQSQSQSVSWIGLLGGIGAGVLWGTYFIPIKLSDASIWVASFPLAVGIFTGSTLLVMITRQTLRLDHKSYYARVGATGVLWGIGNFAMLLLVDQIGAGRGFTISQLGIVVNGLIGVYLLKDPQPNSRAATLTLMGCALATVGGILLGNLR